MTTRSEFESAKRSILEYLVGALRRKTEEFKAAPNDKEKRRVKFLMNFLSDELRAIKALSFEDMPDAK